MNAKINIPQLRFSEFSEEWKEKKLGNIAIFYNSQRIPLTESDREKGEYPYYGASGIIDFVKDFIFDGEYILLGEDGANIVLRNSRLAFLAKGKFWVNNHAHVFQAKESNYFLCEALERINYTKYNTGTAQPKLNSDVIKKIKLNLPSKEEQHKIAYFLTAIDTKIKQLTKTENLLKEYKKGTVQKIFSQEIRFKDDEGSNFPKWVDRKLDTVAWYQEGPGVRRNQYRKNGVKLLNVGNIDNNKLMLDKTDRFISEEEAYSNYNHFLVDSGDILIACSGVSFNTYSQKICIAEENHLPLCMNTSTMRFKPLQGIEQIFLYQFLKSTYFKHQVFRILTGSAQFNFGPSHIKYFKIPLPSKPEQVKIANFLSSIDKKIEFVLQQLNQTKEFKKALLQQMFI